jgi:hypothetical protein
MPETEVQQALFDIINRDKHTKIMKAMDRINARFGRDTLRLAVRGYNPRWRLKQEEPSKRYTTIWKEIYVKI